MTLLLVLVGGGLGGLTRYVVTGVVQRRVSGWWPAGTMTVNLAGSALLGFVLACGLEDPFVVPVTAGFLGGLTTFSTWMVETLAAGQGGRVGARRAGLNIAVPLIAGVLLAGLGFGLGTLVR